MNFITNWVMKHTQIAEFKKGETPDDDIIEFKYDEVTTFYILVHIFKRLNWR